MTVSMDFPSPTPEQVYRSWMELDAPEDVPLWSRTMWLVSNSEGVLHVKEPLDVEVSDKQIWAGSCLIAVYIRDAVNNLGPETSLKEREATAAWFGSWGGQDSAAIAFLQENAESYDPRLH